jgi:hypothetical protein
MLPYAEELISFLKKGGKIFFRFLENNSPAADLALDKDMDHPFLGGQVTPHIITV